MSITLHEVSKSYGRQKAVDKISFVLNPGEICGFLGPNGAGKSTTMKIITGCLPTFTGNVRVCGIDIRKEPLKAKRFIGYLPEHNPLYPEMYIREYLEHIARLYGVDHPRQKTEEIIRLTGLSPEIKKKIGALSKGYRQRVGLAQALIHDPEILILDEPMTGLDPNQLEEIRELVKTVGKNKTVLLSTHIMQEVEAICDRVLIINQGKIVADQSIQSLKQQSGNQMSIFIRFAPNTDTSWLLQSGLFETLQPYENNGWQGITAPHADSRVELFQQAAAHQCPIIELKTETHNLEEIFRQFTHKK